MKNGLLYTTGVLALLLFNGSLSAQEAFLGIRYNEVSPSKAKKLGFENTHGVYLTSVYTNSTAAAMGLQPFDYIDQINGKALSNNYDLHDAFSSITPGSPVRVGFLRAGQRQEVTRNVGTKAGTERIHRRPEDDPFLGIAESHSGPGNQSSEGVPVNIVDCSTAAEMGLQNGDVVTKIDAFPTLDWHDLTAAINNRAVGEDIEVTFQRANTLYTASLPIKSYQATKQEPCNSAEETGNTPPNPLLEEIPVPEGNIEPVPTTQSTDEIDMWMEDVSEEEALEMKEQKGIDMPIVNDLQIARLNVFPNPSTGIFNLQFELPEQGLTNIRLFNAQGRLIYQYDLGQFSGPFQDQINLSNNFKGTYFLEIRQGGASITQKLIVQ